MTDKLHIHASGATSGELKPPMFLLTWLGVKLTALRFGYGNQKHEAGTTLYAEANWLKAFHARDLHFFRDRAAHAIDHICREMSGHEDEGPGGNWGAVGWCVEVLPYVKQYDPEFYKAVQGIAPHPGLRTAECGCPRCAAPHDDGTKPEPPVAKCGYRDIRNHPGMSCDYPIGHDGPHWMVLMQTKIPRNICSKCQAIFAMEGECNYCDYCPECCKCL